jgi:hypothetical protein
MTCSECNWTGLERNGTTVKGKPCQYICSCPAGDKLIADIDKKKKKNNTADLLYQLKERMTIINIKANNVCSETNKVIEDIDLIIKWYEEK